MRPHNIFALLALALTSLAIPKLSAQDTVSIAAKSIYTNAQVTLRWAPMDIASWRYGNANGYRLERKTLRSNGNLLNITDFDASLLVLSTALVALPESQWESMSDSSDLAGVAAGAIYGDSLDLLPPEGGGLLQVYNKARELENRFGYSLFAADQDLQIAKAMGLAFVDTAVQAGKEYVYFIRALGPAATKGGFTSVETDSASVTHAPGGLMAVPADKAVVLQWNKDETRFSSFVLERATGAAGAFTALNATPLIFAGTTDGVDGPMSYIDSLADNSTTYVYRVRGRTPFGSLSAPSDTIHVVGMPGPLSFLMSIESIEEATEGELSVTWEFPSVIESQMLGFDIYRSDKVDGAFTKLNTSVLGTSQRSYVDAQPLPANYYVVAATDLNGHEYRTFPYLGQPKDDTPPVQPTVLAGECDAAGVVTLTWSKNPDPDILGYRVFMSNAVGGDYAQVTGTWLKDTVYRYQTEINTLTEEMYFTVKALDFRQNQSVMSTPLMVSRPDVIPPSPPVITKAEAFTTGVYFEWELSSSSDVVSYMLERRELGIPEWVPVVGFDAGQPLPSFTDTTASGRKRYEYRLVAEDDAALRSSSRIIKIKPVDSGLRHAVQNFAGQLVQNPKSVVLQWDYTNDADLTGFEIFRAINDVNKQRTYDFLKIPPGQPGGAASNGSTAVLTGSTWNCVFTDKDVDFTLLQQNTFVVFPNQNANVNAAVPAPAPPQQGTTVSTFNVLNPNNLAGQQNNQPIVLYYWVMAKYADGGYSPVAGPVEINLQ